MAYENSHKNSKTNSIHQQIHHLYHLTCMDLQTPQAQHSSDEAASGRSSCVSNYPHVPAETSNPPDQHVPAQVHWLSWTTKPDTSTGVVAQSWGPIYLQQLMHSHSGERTSLKGAVWRLATSRCSVEMQDEKSDTEKDDEGKEKSKKGSTFILR